MQKAQQQATKVPKKVPLVQHAAVRVALGQQKLLCEQLLMEGKGRVALGQQQVAKVPLVQQQQVVEVALGPHRAPLQRPQQCPHQCPHCPHRLPQCLLLHLLCPLPRPLPRPLPGQAVSQCTW